MDHLRFTEKHLRASKNSYKKGLQSELEASFTLHQKYQPLLISSAMLRQYGCGQVDLACIYQGGIYLFEVKNHPSAISPKQLLRLKKSASLLSLALEAPCYLRLIKSLPKD